MKNVGFDKFYLSVAFKERWGQN